MPKYLVNTPTYSPISFADRIKPMEAYVDTYNKLTEDEMKTTALLDMIPSMLDTTNEKDAALKQDYDTFKQSMSGMVDNIASGNLRNIASDARNLKRGYTEKFAKIPIAYAAKQEAIKNFKGGADWLGDRPEYHATADFIGGTPTFDGMSQADVYKTSKEVMQGISGTLYNEIPWHLNPDLLNSYFTHVMQEGATEDAVAAFARAIQEDGALHAAVPPTEGEAFKYANRITAAMNSGFNSIVDHYHPERLTRPGEKERFIGSVLDGMQAGSSGKMTEKELQYRDPDAVGSGRRGSYSGGPRNPQNTEDNRGIVYGRNIAGDKVSPSNDWMFYEMPDGTSYYTTAQNISDYNRALEANAEEREKYLQTEYHKQTHKYAIPAYSNGEKSQDYIDWAAKNWESLDDAYKKLVKEKYLIRPQEDMLKAFKYLNLDTDENTLDVGSGIARNERAKRLNFRALRFEGTSHDEILRELSSAAMSSLGANRSKVGTNVAIQQIDSKGELDQIDKAGDAGDLLQDMYDHPSNYPIVSNDKYGVVVQKGSGKGVTQYVLHHDALDGVIQARKSIQPVLDFTQSALGINNQTTGYNERSVVSFINKGFVPDGTKKTQIPNTQWYICTFNTGDNIYRIVCDAKNNIVDFDGVDLWTDAKDFGTTGSALSGRLNERLHSVLTNMLTEKKAK